MKKWYEMKFEVKEWKLLEVIETTISITFISSMDFFCLFFDNFFLELKIALNSLTFFLKIIFKFPHLLDFFFV